MKLLDAQATTAGYIVSLFARFSAVLQRMDGNHMNLLRRWHIDISFAGVELDRDIHGIWELNEIDLSRGLISASHARTTRSVPSGFSKMLHISPVSVSTTGGNGVKLGGKSLFRMQGGTDAHPYCWDSS